MSYFIRNGNTFRVADEKAIDLHEALPVGNYTIKATPQGELYLEQIDDFTKPPKLYGNTTRHAERILNTFRNRTASTGVMLNGEKGSGKTLLAKMLSFGAAEMNIPSIIINSPWCGEEFNTFIQKIDQECVILFDEFEKVYDREQQQMALTLLDGVYPSKKLFVLTCNDRYRVDEHMRNRPGRIFYMIDFKGLEVEFIREYCEDNLLNKDHIERIVNISSIFDAFNFDMLKAMVEEMNRYGETPQDVLKYLNVRQEFDAGGHFSVEVLKNNVLIENHDFASEGFRGNPMRGTEFDVWIVDPTPREELEEALSNKPRRLRSENGDWHSITITPNNMTRIDSVKGVFEFVVDEYKITFTRQREKEINYYAF